MDENEKPKEMKFETALLALENLVEKMQKSELDLDKLIVLYEEGIGYLRICQKGLAEAEMKVNLLNERIKKVQAGENG